ncbi:MAG: GTP cyclohydrolase II [Myxococcales bacterium]|nr:GTP cyclohydrolase II [Myxococcales bacterium]
MYVAASAIRPLLQVRAEATVPTRFGEFNMMVFNYGSSEKAPDRVEGSSLSPDHMALVRGNLKGKHRVLCRIHSECLTSEVFGSLKCDCKEQLEAAQAEIARVGEGIILYLRQEGRGIGLANKIRAYQLQSQGHDTVDANRLLDLPDDAREYDAAAAMLGHLGIASVRLMTNNPLKVEAMRKLGVVVDERAPSHIRPNVFSKNYLDAKRQRMNHALPEYDLLEEVC